MIGIITKNHTKGPKQETRAVSKFSKQKGVTWVQEHLYETEVSRNISRKEERRENRRGGVGREHKKKRVKQNLENL